MEQTIQNSFESKVSMKAETNSRGYNTTVHCYAGVTQNDIDECVKMTIYAHKKLQEKLVSNESG